MEQFNNPAAVVLIIEPGIPGEQNVFSYPDRLPALPQIGQRVCVDVVGRNWRYVARVADVVFVMRLEGGGACCTQEVEIQCNLIDRQTLTQA